MTSLASELFAGGEEDRLRFMSFSEAMMAAEEFSSPFNVDSWQELYLHLTPHDCLSSAASTYGSIPEECGGNDGFGDSLLCNIKYEQIVDALHETEFALSGQQPAEDLLIQDCMWSSSNDDKDATLSSTASEKIPEPIPTKLQPEPSSAPDCVEPSVVFPTLHHATPQTVKVPNGAPINTMRSPQSSSESEEEIDVVTVEHRTDQQDDMDTSPINTKTLVQAQLHMTKSLSSTKSLLNNQLKTTTRKMQSHTGITHNCAANNVGKVIPPRRKRHAKRQSRLSSQDGNESDEEARRASHNVLERKRRNDLKNSFDILRTGIPDLEENIRAPKVVILRKAVEYIKMLQVNDRKIECDWSREHKRNNKLRERLSHLKKNPLTI